MQSIDNQVSNTRVDIIKSVYGINDFVWKRGIYVVLERSLDQ